MGKLALSTAPGSVACELQPLDINIVSYIVSESSPEGWRAQWPACMVSWLRVKLGPCLGFFILKVTPLGLFPVAEGFKIVPQTIV